MKIAKVIPIFKNEDQTSFCNYIPISLLQVISKVIEKVIYNHNQMYSFFFINTNFLMITSMDLDLVTQRNTPFWKLSTEQ